MLLSRGDDVDPEEAPTMFEEDELSRVTKLHPLEVREDGLDGGSLSM